MNIVILLAIIGVSLFATVVAAMARYKTCPSNKILVKHGKVGKGKSALPYHGGATFVWPLIQQYSYLNLTPITTDIALTGALSKQNIRVNVPSRFTFGIGTTPELMNNAAERLLGLTNKDIEDTARDIIFGQLRATIATMDIEEINSDREAFEKSIMKNVESELKKIGLCLINVNISDITDESGYIEALGKKAASEAVNQAKVQVAQKDRDGSVGSAEAEQDQRVKVAAANAKAVQGENTAKADIANSDADRISKEAEAQRLGDAAVLVKAAEAKKEGYKSEQEAEKARADKDRATQNANIVVPAEIAKQKAIIDAEADKEQEILKGQAEGEALKVKIEKEAEADAFRIEKQGEAEGKALKLKMQGQAEGTKEILSKQAEGLDLFIKAAGGNPDKAAMLMIIQKLPEIAKLQAEAISNIDFGKVVVYDGGSGSKDGGSTTSNWLSSITKSLPGLHEFAEMSGIQLPGILGKVIENGDITENDADNTSDLDPKDKKSVKIQKEVDEDTLIASDEKEDDNESKSS
jgi:flotillin